MRFLYIGLVILITAAILMFKVQNLDTVTLSLLTASITLPLSLLIIGVYFLGMLTGGMVVSAVRSLIDKAQIAPKK